ncbi:MAG: ATP-grasp domain-containing protein [Gemmatimonadaceae bacterium]|nr:ATP-grasp domain-containing protein [Gemmatimonadaceae bacterium]
MNVIMLAPGYPGEMPYFCRGLSLMGGKVYGLSDVPEKDLPALTRQHLSGYLRVPNFTDEEAVVKQVVAAVGRNTIDRVACYWEPGVVLAAKIREALDVPGMRVAQAETFRNKDLMKQVINQAGIRTARHASATSIAQVREATEKIGFPVIVKPIAGAGSMDTIRAASMQELDAALSRVTSYDEVNVEEFIEGDEYTYDTICIDGKIVYENVCYYRPNPLVARSTEWISPQTIALRDLDTPIVAKGVQQGHEVLKAMGFQTGMTHMEWFYTARGEPIFGEIAARPPGAHTVDLMNYVGDVDLFTGAAEAELKGTFSASTDRKYNVANVFKRAEGRGRITRIEGLQRLLERYGEHVVHVDLLPVGAERRNWILTLVSDGYVTVRHPDQQACFDIADAFGTDLRLFAQ